MMDMDMVSRAKPSTAPVPSDDFRSDLAMNARRNEFRFFDVQLLKEEQCGTGSYGKVCKAMVDQLVCAAKIIHPTFFSSEIDTSSSIKTIDQFEKECDFLSAIRHPCVVQYLGTTTDMETGLPVLLMELMDESLTRFLDNVRKQGTLVPYSTQVNIVHDISMALAFLHSNGIVHRDLSSNNILLIAGSRAKVTDFGMSRLIENNPRMTPLTQCPGCLVYMAPESLRTPPTYSEKLDVFSMGVCIIQILTCKFPRPSDAKRTVEDPRHGTIEVPIPEQERRRDDIDEVDPNNQLLKTALDCLADSEVNRPTSKDLCHRMIYYKTCPDYLGSREEVRKQGSLVRDLQDVVDQKTREASYLSTEVNIKSAEIESLRDYIENDLKRELNEKDVEMQSLRAELEQLRNELDVRERGVPGITVSPTNSFSRSRSPSLSMASSEGDFERVSLDMKDFEHILTIEEQLSLDAPTSLSWYHGRINRILACQRLESANIPGAYLIRESCNERGALVLSFFDRERRVHHFRIVRNRERQFNIGGNLWFSTLRKLVGFHSKYSSVMEKHSERLEQPVPPPTPVPLPSHVLAGTTV